MAKNFFDDTPETPVEPPVQAQPPLLPPSLPPVPPTPVTPPNVFSDPAPEKPRPPPEMRSYTPSPSENIAYAGQDLLTSLGAKPYQALELSKGVRNAAMLFPPVGAGVSALDAVHDYKKGDYIGGILNTVGAVPGFAWTKALARGRGAAKEVHPGFVDDTNAAVFGRRPEAPSSQALEKRGVEQMDEYRGSGQIYPPSTATDVATEGKKAMSQAGVYPGPNQPVATEALDVIANKGKKNPIITAPDMDELRLALGQAVKKGEPGGAIARSVLFDKLEATGDTNLKQAVPNFAAGHRGEIVDKILENAKRRGGDEGKTIETELRKLVESEKKTRGFTDDEVKVLDKAHKGPLSARVLEGAGDLLSGRGLEGAIRRGLPFGGLGAAAGSYLAPEGTKILGAAVGGAIPQAVGTVLKSAAAPIRADATRAAGDVIRQRSPLYKEIVDADAAAPYLQSSPGQKAALRNALVQILIDQENQKPLDLRERGKR